MSKKDIDASANSCNAQVAIYSDGIEIKHKGKPVTDYLSGDGFVFLVIDCSYSMYGDKFNQAKNGALSFAKDAISKGYSTGLIQFNSSSTLLSEPTRELLMLEQCVAKMLVKGSTNMAEAISLAHQHLMNRVGNKTIVIVTDGVPDSIGNALEKAEIAKKSNIDIIAIGTDDADKDFLKHLASRSDLGMKVTRECFEESITSSANLLGSGK